MSTSKFGYLKKTIIAAFSGLLCIGVSSASELNVYYGAAISSLSPHKVVGTWESPVVTALYEGLITRNKEGEVILGVAKSYKLSKDGKTYTFTLKDNLKWSDGVPFVAGDFVFSFRQLLDPANGAKYANLLYLIKNARAINSGKEKDLTKLGVSAPDDKTVVIELEGPAPYFLELLTHYTALPLPKHAYDFVNAKNVDVKKLVVNGPYQVVEWLPGAHVILEKNPLYHDLASVKSDKVTFYTLEDPKTAYDLFRAGKLDYMNSLPKSAIKELMAKKSKELHIHPLTGVYYYAINNTLKPFDNVKIREALSISVNRKVIAEKIVGFGQIPAYGWVPPGLPNYGDGYKPDWASKSYKEHVAKAKKILKEAGYSTDNPLKLTISYNTLEAHKQIAVAIAAMWKQLGVDVKLFNYDVNVHFKNLDDKNFEIGRAGWVADFNDPVNFIDLFLSNNTFNYNGYKNEKLDTLIKKSYKENDLKKRAELLKEAEDIAMKDFAAIPIYYYVSANLVSEKVSGYASNIVDDHLVKYMSVAK